MITAATSDTAATAGIAVATPSAPASMAISSPASDNAPTRTMTIITVLTMPKSILTFI